MLPLLLLKYFKFLLLLLTITKQLKVDAKIYVNVISDGPKSSLDGHWCYDDMLRNFTEQLQDLKATNQRLEQALAAQQKSLAEMKVLLEQTKPAVNTALPNSCADAMKSNSTSGIYEILVPHMGLKSFRAYCLQDPNNGLPWLVIQRRLDGTTNFYRGWQNYKHGFGNLNAEFFIGLEKIHAITHAEQHELWIQLEDFEGERRYAKYETFEIGSELEKYALKVLGEYQGNAGNALLNHEGSKFSTKDSDNDAGPDRCAVHFKGAWWYHKCHESNLNGEYLKGANTKDNGAQGIQWITWHPNYSLKYVQMAIRAVA